MVPEQTLRLPWGQPAHGFRPKQRPARRDVHLDAQLSALMLQEPATDKRKPQREGALPPVKGLAGAGEQGPRRPGASETQDRLISEDEPGAHLFVRRQMDSQNCLWFSGFVPKGNPYHT